VETGVVILAGVLAKLLLIISSDPDVVVLRAQFIAPAELVAVDLTC